ncbi:MAG: hypothetical protein BJ554DRAFT_3888 [Olpidium bornovanus]|uniref:RNA polymerase II assembly factor Rtp1 C-terminal domain-containing protein n=1 Tax=Olpidium bornovanus TaxID=278681 RepID=A0A8H7ZNH1_9FUNG|nr:MAG: hypothetical protein BJ554DRAFT_3888 [Olpidium bornovanus]
MIQSLGPAILKRPTQMLSVAVSILESWKDPEERMLEARTERLNARNSATGDFGGAPRMFADIVSGLDEQEEEEMMRVVEEENRLQEDTLLLAMSMTAAIVAEHKDLTSQDLGLLQAALPLLARFADNPSSVLRESAAEVRGAVLTRTVAGLSLKSTGSDAVQQGLERFRSACSMIEESLLPVRAHGLALLRELVLERNPVIDEHLEIGSGSDDAGRKTLTDTQGERIIQKLGELYRGTGVLGKQLDARLRIGEALSLTFFGPFGLTAPLYAESSKQRHLRASALSILAVACETCPHSLGRLHHDIVNYVLYEEVRVPPLCPPEAPLLPIRPFKAATVVLVFLIRGLGPDVLGAFPKDLIRRAAVALRNVEALDADELARHQARIGLEELEIAVLEALVPFEA